uniref:Uncharacterized protein B23H20.020 n=1 Tax=Neurospora crassa TaxID=5141 RepID=Q8X011_NEUCS|nr:hypothetical protein [Neurospora crassa]
MLVSMPHGILPFSSQASIQGRCGRDARRKEPSEEAEAEEDCAGSKQGASAYMFLSANDIEESSEAHGRAAGGSPEPDGQDQRKKGEALKDQTAAALSAEGLAASLQADNEAMLEAAVPDASPTPGAGTTHKRVRNADSGVGSSVDSI